MYDYAYRFWKTFFLLCAFDIKDLFFPKEFYVICSEKCVSLSLVNTKITGVCF